MALETVYRYTCDICKCELIEGQLNKIAIEIEDTMQQTHRWSGDICAGCLIEDLKVLDNLPRDY